MAFVYALSLCITLLTEQKITFSKLITDPKKQYLKPVQLHFSFCFGDIFDNNVK